MGVHVYGETSAHFISRIGHSTVVAKLPGLIIQARLELTFLLYRPLFFCHLNAN